MELGAHTPEVCQKWLNLFSHIHKGIEKMEMQNELIEHSRFEMPYVPTKTTTTTTTHTG